MAGFKSTERYIASRDLEVAVNASVTLQRPLLVKGEPGLIRRISYAHVQQDEIFDLPGIVSRKKQLIPYFASLLKEMQTDGEPSPKANRKRR